MLSGKNKNMYSSPSNCISSKWTRLTVVLQIKPVHSSNKPGSDLSQSPELFPRQPESPVNNVITSDRVRQSIPPPSKNRSNQEPHLKRAHSFPGNDRSVPAKLFRHDLVETEKQISEKDHTLYGTGNVSGQNVNSEYISALPTHAQLPMMNTQANMPYANWPYDPRIALFLRNGFVQTYHNLIEMYNAGASKIKQTDTWPHLYHVYTIYNTNYM